MKGGTCPFCGLAFLGKPNQCNRCGALLGEAREDLKREGVRQKKAIRFQKAQADLFFLVGLLLGGPMMTFGGETRWGLFVVLAGGFASALRRYTASSAWGSGVVGSLVAVLVATLVVDPVQELAEDVDTGEAARVAFVTTMGEVDPDIRVEARGPGAVTVWFTVPDLLAGECGSYPSQELQGHLADLGVLRIVVMGQTDEGGVCSFAPEG
jgi:hypothetical protein